MDAFASILASEMRKKGASGPTTSKASKTTDTTTSSSKFLKRGELEKKRQEEYYAEQKRLEEERAERAAKKRKLDEEAAMARERIMEKKQRLREEKERAKKEKEEEEEEERRRKLAAKQGVKDGETAQENGTDSSTVEQMDEETAIKKLRELEQPIRLFGESHTQRLRRLKKLTDAKSRDNGSSAASSKRSPSPAPLSGKDMLIDPADVTKNPNLVYQQLHAWFSLLISEWEKALADRPMAIKESYQGKQATTAMRQAVDYIQPLFRHFKRKDLEDDILTRVVEIVVEAQARRYVKANDVYLRLSIGNAYVERFHPYIFHLKFNQV